MKPLFVAVLLLLAAPAGASAAIDVYFQVNRYGDTASGGIRATNFEYLAPYPFCDPARADCRTGPPTTLSLERGGQIVAESPPNPPLVSSITFARPALGLVPQAGDRVHVIADGVERAVIAYDGLPAIDGGCSPEGATVTGDQTPGASLEAQLPTFGAPVLGTVRTDGGRFTATFPSALRGTSFVINSHTTAPALDGSAVGVHVLHSTAGSCALGTGARKLVKLDISGKKLRKVRVDRRGRFKLLTRVTCPPELPMCRVFISAYAIKRNGDTGRSLGDVNYTVPGGTNRRVHGRINARVLAALRRSGKRRAFFSIVIRRPSKLPDGITTGPDLHGGYPGYLLAR